MADHQSAQSHKIWVLRIWQESDNGNWRATVSQSPDAQQDSFTTKGSLIAFLEDAMAAVTSTNK